MPLKKIARLSMVIVSCSGGALAQTDIPSPVIEACNATAAANELPDCLKNGAIAYEMLSMVQNSDFYGEAARPVIEACQARNDSFETAWICFRSAAQDAAETRELVGLENIANQCLAGISDPVLASRILEINLQLRRTRFPDEYFTPSTMYYPFRECPSNADAGRNPSSPSNDAGGNGADGRLDTRACAALEEIDTIIATRSADDLRAIGAEMEEADDPTGVVERIGLSAEARDWIFRDDADQDHGMLVAAMLGTFIHDHHPDLLMEIFAQQNPDALGPAAVAGGDMAEQIVMMVVGSARERYDAACGAN
jgi:hypothetical protein